MLVRIGDMKEKQVICVKTGSVLGNPGDVEFDAESGTVKNLVLYGRPRLFGLLGRDPDVVVPWSEIEIIGEETVLVKTEFLPTSSVKKTRFSLFGG